MKIQFINTNKKDVKYFLSRSKDNEKWLGYNEEGMQGVARVNQLAYDLIDLYNQSSKHNAIITSKVNYITGEGLKSENPDEQTKKFLLRANRNETANELFEKIALDYELQGGFYVQLVFSKLGGVLVDSYHMPFQKMQPSEDGNKFKYTPDPKKPREYEVFDRYVEGQNTGTKVLFISKYRAGSDVLPLPDYFASLKYIQIDAEIANFNLSNIRSGFSAGTMIVFADGEPDPEEEDAIINQLQNSTSGTDAAGGVFVYFKKIGSETPEIIPLNGNDLVERFANLNEQCKDEIMIGHKVVSPMLFGVRTEGQLGGRNEMIEAFELFNNSYIKPAQQIFTSTFNFLNRLSGGQSTISVRTPLPIGLDLIQLFQEGILTDLPYIQKELGLPVKKVETNLREYDGKFRDTDWHEFVNFGEAAEGYEILKEMDVFFNSQNVPVSFDSVDDDILKAIATNPAIDVASLINALDLDAKDASERIGRLIEDKLINPEKGLQITPEGELTIDKAPKSQFFVKYQYSGPKDSRNRAFCARLLQLNRVYTREEINQLSGILGYNVWMRRGGWYHNPKLDVNTPYCRHTWKQVIVKRRI